MFNYHLQKKLHFSLYWRSLSVTIATDKAKSILNINTWDIHPVKTIQTGWRKVIFGLQRGVKNPSVCMLSFKIYHVNKCVFSLLSKTSLHALIREAAFKQFHLTKQSYYLVNMFLNTFYVWSYTPFITFSFILIV